MKKLYVLLFVLTLTACVPEAVVTETTPIDEAEIQAIVDAYLETIEPTVVTVEETTTVPDASVVITIDSLDQAMNAVIDQVELSVIAVANKTETGEYNGTGSGVVYKLEDGWYYAVTNNHVVEGSASLDVFFDEARNVPAELVGTDAEQDVAVIKFQTTEPVMVSSFADPTSVEQGDFVVAIGSPSGLTYFNSTTMGIISGVDRYVGLEDTDGDGYDDVFAKMLQHDAAINPGNSGGPLFNLQGEIIGINTLKLVDNTIEGMGFSIPVDTVQRVIEDLEAFGYVQYAKLGVYVGDIRYMDNLDTSILEGVHVASIVDGGPVDTSSDLEVGDIIVSFGGVDLEGLYMLKDILFHYHPGDEVEVGYYRNDVYRETTVILGEK